MLVGVDVLVGVGVELGVLLGVALGVGVATGSSTFQMDDPPAAIVALRASAHVGQVFPSTAGEPVVRYQPPGVHGSDIGNLLASAKLLVTHGDDPSQNPLGAASNIAVAVGVAVDVLVGVLLGVAVGVFVAVLVGTGVLVDVFVAVLVGTGVLVDVFVSGVAVASQ